MLDLEPLTTNPRPTIHLDTSATGVPDHPRTINEELDREHQELVAALQKELGLT